MKTQTQNTGAAHAVAVTNMHSKDTQHLGKIREYGIAIASKSGELTGLYLALCTYIRKNEVDAKLVSFELGQLGFRKQRITEINRVASAPERLWSQYEARALGFDKTLAIARIEHKGAAPVLTPVGEQLKQEGALTPADAKTAIAQVKDGNGHGTRDGRKSRSTAKRNIARRSALADSLLATLTADLKYPMVFKRDQFVLTITVDTKAKGSPPNVK